MSSDDVEKGEKNSRENRKIINLLVGQDTAYWDLNETLRQIETNYEKLQKNMLEVQLQFGTLSGQNQEELRQRPEILNKLDSFRETCNVLVEYSEQLRETLSRCKADQTALCETCQQSDVVREMKTQQLQNDEKNKQIIKNLQDKLKMTTEQHGQLAGSFTVEKQRLDAELGAVRTDLAAALAAKERLATAYWRRWADCTRQLQKCRHELKKKEKLLVEMKQLLHQFNIKASKIKNKMHKVEKELKETTASKEFLKNMLSNLENLTKDVWEQNNHLQEKIASLEEEKSSTCNVVKNLEDQIKEWTQTNEHMKKELADLSEKNNNLEIKINEKVQRLMDVENEKQSLLAIITGLENQVVVMVAANEVNQTLDGKIQEIGVTHEEQGKLIDHIKAKLNSCRDEAEARLTELTAVIETKNQELDSKASTISHLMNKMKDEDLSKHMKIIMELRSDKERLQNKIQSMQNKIDNIQKKLTGQPSSRPSRMKPELDDNVKQLEVPAPRRDQENDTPFNFLSDSSVDADY